MGSGMGWDGERAKRVYLAGEKTEVWRSTACTNGLTERADHAGADY